MHRKIIVLLWSNLLSLINARTLLASSSSKVSRQGTSYASNAEAALSVLQQWYNTGTGLYDTTGWWNSANCITILADLVAVDSNVQSTTDQVFTNTFARAPTQNTKKIKRSMIYPENKRTATVAGADAGWLNGFYDDEVILLEALSFDCSLSVAGLVGISMDQSLRRDTWTAIPSSRYRNL